MLRVRTAEATRRRQDHKSSMWMSAALPLSSSTTWPSNVTLYSITTARTTKLRQRRFPFAVSAQSRQLPPQKQDDDREKGVMSQAVLTAIKSKVKHRSSSSSGTKRGEQPSSPREPPGQQRQLRGSDVLWALKRATAEKAKKSKKDISLTSRAQKDRNEEDKTADYSAVRPLTIKSEWSDRLEQLEKRLQLLVNDI